MTQVEQRRFDDGFPGAANPYAATGGSEPSDRLEAALARIAAAAGRRKDSLRVAELNARAAQHENQLLREAEARAVPADEIEARRERDALLAERENELRSIAVRLDALIAAVSDALGGQDFG